MSYEKIILVGNLGETPERRTAKDGQPVTSFSVAVNRKQNGQKVTTWYRITVMWNIPCGRSPHNTSYLGILRCACIPNNIYLERDR